MASLLQRLATSVSPACAAVGDVRQDHGCGRPSVQAGCSYGSSWSARERSTLRWAESQSFLLPKSFSVVFEPARMRQQRPSPICMVLPTRHTEKTSGKDHPSWEARAVKSFSMSELEARKLKYPTTGTEALLMGILTEGTSEASRFLRKNGVTLFGVRDETVKLLGKADMYFFSPEHPPLTEPALQALDWALDEKSRLGGEGEISTSLMLLGIWAQKGSAGQQVLATLGFDDNKAADLLTSFERASRSWAQLRNPYRSHSDLKQWHAHSHDQDCKLVFNSLRGIHCSFIQTPTSDFC